MTYVSLSIMHLRSVVGADFRHLTADALKHRRLPEPHVLPQAMPAQALLEVLCVRRLATINRGVDRRKRAASGVRGCGIGAGACCIAVAIAVGYGACSRGTGFAAVDVERL